ncbi:hypothetical protein Z517_03775 [Fonsecaea pedrosoi CBS 271.37]|uniref:Cyclase n=1 Tax=Fonsecaea pedrosoi CBS 271.37 TaxID=1442368 RepID=A0A0D2H115_9EURO|nr:uncharacterized protein Z517_03775 [Fonsecaea pedrosoi CBS 271.37]KIW84525.1 hypothetical protein Z517_03775 [Fonsecaea pedrosoi CBS 271.37]
MPTFDPDSDHFPNLADLEQIPGAPKHAAWFWGENDELGRLNLLTARRVADAARLIRTGERVALNFPLDYPDPPFFGRETFKHRLKQLNESSYDDLYDFNSQSGSQWDGYRHSIRTKLDRSASRIMDLGFGITIPLASKLSIHRESDSKHGENRASVRMTAHGLFLVRQIDGSIMKLTPGAFLFLAGRAVLLDIYSFTKESYDPLSARRITLAELRACAEAEGVEFKYGDILLVRTGWSAGYNQLDAAGRQAYRTKGFHELAFAGVGCGEEVVEFLHDNYFSAVASDSPTFESWPPSLEPGQEILHSFLLPLWGVPIGEMWDLDGLAELCKKTRRWEFFLTSCPANVKGEKIPVPVFLSPELSLLILYQI